MVHSKNRWEGRKDTASTGLPAAGHGSTSTSATLDAVLPLIRPTRQEVHLNSFLLQVLEPAQLVNLARHKKIGRYLLCRLSDTVALVDAGCRRAKTPKERPRRRRRRWWERRIKPAPPKRGRRRAENLVEWLRREGSIPRLVDGVTGPLQSAAGSQGLTMELPQGPPPDLQDDGRKAAARNRDSCVVYPSALGCGPSGEVQSALMRLDAADVKKAARIWIGKEAWRMRKAESVAAVSKALSEPGRAAEIIDALPEDQLGVIQVLRLYGGSVSRTVLDAELGARGLVSESVKKGIVGHPSQRKSPVDHMKEKLLVVWIGLHRPYYEDYLDYARSCAGVSMHPGFLNHVAPAKPLRWPGKASREVPDRTYRRMPGAVVLDLLGALRVVEKAGSVRVGKGGRPGENLRRLLARAVPGASASGTEALRPSDRHVLYYEILLRIGPLHYRSYDGTVRVDPADAARAFERDTALFGRALARGWIETRPWQDGIGAVPEKDNRYEPTRIEPEAMLRGRLLLVWALSRMALTEEEAWYDLERFCHDLYDAMGERGICFSWKDFAWAPDFPLGRRKDHFPAGAERSRAFWFDQEAKWVANAVWVTLVDLGFVERGEAGDAKIGWTFPSSSRCRDFIIPSIVPVRGPERPVLRSAYSAEAAPAAKAGSCYGGGSAGGHRAGRKLFFRLTPLGRATFRMGPAAAAEHPNSDASRWFTVQPNYEIVADLPQAPPDSVAHLAGIARAHGTDGPVRTFHLERESINRALANGWDEETVIGFLAEHGRSPVPQNVAHAVAEWIRKRESLILHRDVRLVAFRDRSSRDAFLRRTAGIAVGGYFAAVQDTAGAASAGGPWIDHAGDMRVCLDVRDDGRIRAHRRPDLVALARLAGVAEPEAEGWRVTAASVRRSGKRGIGARIIMEWLEDHAPDEIPPSLAALIQAWAGKGAALSTAEETARPVVERDDFETAAGCTNAE